MKKSATQSTQMSKWKIKLNSYWMVSQRGLSPSLFLSMSKWIQSHTTPYIDNPRITMLTSPKKASPRLKRTRKKTKSKIQIIARTFWITSVHHRTSAPLCIYSLQGRHSLTGFRNLCRSMYLALTNLHYWMKAFLFFKWLKPTNCNNQTNPSQIIAMRNRKNLRWILSMNKRYSHLRCKTNAKNS